ncbi:ArnT family glycosyltransferase [Candidatus Poribacteria bacterium]
MRSPIRLPKYMKSDKAILVLIFLVSVLVRLVVLANTHHEYFGSGMAQGPMARYLTLGRGFVINLGFGMHEKEAELDRLIDVEDYLKMPGVVGDIIDNEENFRPFIAYAMPGQAILLAGTYYIFGEYRYIYLQVIQALVDSLSVFMLYSIAREFFGSKVALLSAFLFSIWFLEARLSVAALRDAWMQVLMLASLYFFLKGSQRERVLYYLLSGLSIALCVYFRSEVILLPLFYGSILLLRKRSFRSLVYNTSMMLIPIVLLLSPWTIRNYVVFHKFIPTNVGLWIATWEGFGEFENDFGAVYSDAITYQQIRDAGHDVEYHSVECDSLFKPKVLDVMKNKTFWYVKVLIKRAIKIPRKGGPWGIQSIDRAVRDFEEFRAKGGRITEFIKVHPIAFAKNIAVRLTTLGIFLLAFVGVLFHRRWLECVMVLSVPIYNILIHLPLGSMSRYILPGNTTLLIFVSFALFQISSRIKTAFQKRNGTSPDQFEY